MIDDSKIRRQILEAIPSIKPWEFEMEEIEHGDSVGISMMDKGNRVKFRVSAYAQPMRKEPKSENTIAIELTKMLKEQLGLLESPKRTTLGLPKQNGTQSA